MAELPRPTSRDWAAEPPPAGGRWLELPDAAAAPRPAATSHDSDGRGRDETDPIVPNVDALDTAVRDHILARFAKQWKTLRRAQ